MSRVGLGTAKTRVVSITSGKGGVGKTSIVSNLALALAREGKRVLILDGDMGMANVDIMFNVRPKLTIHDIVKGTAEIADVLLQVSDDVFLIPGGSGVLALQNMNAFEKQTLLDQVSAMGAEFDVMLIDTAPGIDDTVLYLNSAAQEIYVIVTPEPSSIADSYALIKVLNQRCRETKFSIICNEVRDESDGVRLFNRLDAVAQQFLTVRLEHAASIPADPVLRQSTRKQELVFRAHPDAESSRAIAKLVGKLKGYEAVPECKGSLQFFWEQLVGLGMTD